MLHATRKASFTRVSGYGYRTRAPGVQTRVPRDGRCERTLNSETGFLDKVGRRICYYCVINTLKPTDGPLSGNELYDVQSTRWVESDSSGPCLGLSTLRCWGPL
jgi:hypothetical protein